MLNEDYRDILRLLNDEKSRFLLVEAYALAAHGYLRATMAIVIWVGPTPDTAAPLRAREAGAVASVSTQRACSRFRTGARGGGGAD